LNRLSRRLPKYPTNQDISLALKELAAEPGGLHDWFYVLCCTFLRNLLGHINDSPHSVSEREAEIVDQFSILLESGNVAIERELTAELFEAANGISALIREIGHFPGHVGP
jgi:hypothetical protein